MYLLGLKGAEEKKGRRDKTDVLGAGLHRGIVVGPHSGMLGLYASNEGSFPCHAMPCHPIPSQGVTVAHGVCVL